MLLLLLLAAGAATAAAESFPTCPGCPSAPVAAPPFFACPAEEEEEEAKDSLSHCVKRSKVHCSCRWSYHSQCGDWGSWYEGNHARCVLPGTDTALGRAARDDICCGGAVCACGSCGSTFFGSRCCANRYFRALCEVDTRCAVPAGCELCEPGYYLAEGGGECRACGDAAHFCSGNNERSKVDVGYYSLGGAQPELRTSQALCEPGFECRGDGLRRACAEGTFSDSPGASSCGECAACGGDEFRAGCGGGSGGDCHGCAHRCDCSVCPESPTCCRGGLATCDGTGVEDTSHCAGCVECGMDEWVADCGGSERGRCRRCEHTLESCVGHNRYLLHRCDGSEASGDAAICETCPGCGAGERRVGCSGIDRGTCETCSQCAQGTFVLEPCSAAADTQCKAYAACAPGTYEKTPGTAEADRQCAAWSVCVAGKEFEVSPPTNVTNRVCQALTTCNHVFQYQEKAPTTTSDRVCSTKTLCGANQFQSRDDGNGTRDVTCQDLKNCHSEGLFELRKPAMDRDRVCAHCLDYPDGPPTTFNSSDGWRERCEVHKNTAGRGDNGGEVGSRGAGVGVVGGVTGILGLFVVGALLYRRRAIHQAQDLRRQVAERDDMLHAEMVLNPAGPAFSPGAFVVGGTGTAAAAAAADMAHRKDLEREETIAGLQKELSRYKREEQQQNVAQATGFRWGGRGARSGGNAVALPSRKEFRQEKC